MTINWGENDSSRITNTVKQSSWRKLGHIHFLLSLTISWQRPLSYRNQSIDFSPLICSTNQWTGFYMNTASVLKELKLLELEVMRVIRKCSLCSITICKLTRFFPIFSFHLPLEKITRFKRELWEKMICSSSNPSNWVFTAEKSC